MNNAPSRRQPNSESSRRSSNIQGINKSTRNDKGDTAQPSHDSKRGIQAIEIPSHQSTIHSRAKIGGSRDSLDQDSDMEDTDSDEFPENLVTTGTRAKPSKFKENSNKKNMVLEDIYEAETSSERSDQSSTKSSPRVKRNKGKGIAVPSDDETPELGDEHDNRCVYFM